MTRILRLLGLPLGVAVVVWLVLESDPAALFGVFPRIGWGFVAIVAARAATVVIDCGAWQCLLPRRDRPAFATMLPLRWISESINTTLPAAQIGGEVVRARLLQRRLDAPARGGACSPPSRDRWHGSGSGGWRPRCSGSGRRSACSRKAARRSACRCHCTWQ